MAELIIQTLLYKHSQTTLCPHTWFCACSKSSSCTDHSMGSLVHKHRAIPVPRKHRAFPLPSPKPADRTGKLSQDYLQLIRPTSQDGLAPQASGSPGPKPFSLLHKKTMLQLTLASYTASDDRFTSCA